MHEIAAIIGALPPEDRPAVALVETSVPTRPAPAAISLPGIILLLAGHAGGWPLSWTDPEVEATLRRAICQRPVAAGRAGTVPRGIRPSTAIVGASDPSTRASLGEALRNNGVTVLAEAEDAHALALAAGLSSAGLALAAFSPDSCETRRAAAILADLAPVPVLIPVVGYLTGAALATHVAAGAGAILTLAGFADEIGAALAHPADGGCLVMPAAASLIAGARKTERGLADLSPRQPRILAPVVGRCTNSVSAERLHFSVRTDDPSQSRRH